MIDEQLVDTPEQQFAKGGIIKMRVNVEDRSLLDDLCYGVAKSIAVHEVHIVRAV
jgi:hypothetical protein